MAKEITVREYRPEDQEQVVALARELEAELAEKFKDVEIKSGLDDYRNRYLKPGHKYKTFVALVDGHVVGYLIGYPSLGAPEVDYTYDILPKSLLWAPPEFFLQVAFVSKPYRNLGISKRLHIAIIEYARDKGFLEVYTCIAKWNIPEIEVIKSLKFKVKDLGYRYRLTLKL